MTKLFRRAPWTSLILLLALPLHGGAIPAARPVPQVQRALVVSIDGLRPDLLLRAQAPNIHTLIGRGSFSFWARTVDEGYTVPSHVSMLTGVVPARHGVTWDTYVEGAYPQVPTLFELARKAGYTTALAVGKSKLTVLTKPGTLDWKYVADESREGDQDVARHAAAMLRDQRPGVLFVHLGGVDVAGHASGWGSREQMKAIEAADRAVGTILLTLAQTSLVDSTLVIVTADHGGAGLLHPPEDPRSQFIPWIAAGPGVRRDFDLTMVPGLTISTMDTFATVCAMLGITVDPAVDGKPVLAILETAPGDVSGRAPASQRPAR